MVNDIVNGISTALYSEFGAGYPIYTEEVKQGLKEPCFFIDVPETEQERLVGNRYLMTVSVNVMYFPASNAKAREMREVKEKLYAILERITLLDGSGLNGIQLHGKEVDNVLHFFVTYRPFGHYPEATADSMAGIVLATGIKEGE